MPRFGYLESAEVKAALRDVTKVARKDTKQKVRTISVEQRRNLRKKRKGSGLTRVPAIKVGTDVYPLHIIDNERNRTSLKQATLRKFPGQVYYLPKLPEGARVFAVPSKDLLPLCNGKKRGFIQILTSDKTRTRFNFDDYAGFKMCATTHE